ncbi:CCAAT/enhancer binding protein (C/EBP) 1 isoform X1 [Hypomesus transpacificus]|uniref:CCAAT/enhancer binding protein (C/EBP) 1 isoform X1 n=2 Tax=Hypomesus transpacificus TaxID=137520 RepID=UPI001F07D811|nr:CCAAT/enhancer binding protein (C/EBP) 1 isoform X1 [Hypomesus transpacificus]
MSESKQSSVNPDYMHLLPASFSSCSLTSNPSSLAFTPNPSTATYLANHLPQMEGMPCGQSEGSSGLARTGNDRVAEHLMGLSYLSYTPCLNPSNTVTSSHQSSLMQQEFSPFLLPSPPGPARGSTQKRGFSKDSVEYRLRRERNNIAVRKSRDKARRRIQLTQHRALQLEDENRRLQGLIGQLTQELENLRRSLSHLPSRPMGDRLGRGGS